MNINERKDKVLKELNTLVIQYLEGPNKKDLFDMISSGELSSRELSRHFGNMVKKHVFK